MKMNVKWLAAFAVAGTIGAGMTFSAMADDKPATPSHGDKPGHTHKDGEKHDHSKDEKTTKTAKVGEAAPSFTLTDTDGKTVKLEDYKGKIVVLEWFNPDCPHIVKHHKDFPTFNTLYQEYNSKNVVFLAINSGAAGMSGAGKDHNIAAKKDFKLAYPILLDESGTVGQAYGAKTTPHCFVIGTDGKLAYNGAIDNSRDLKKAGDKNYVKLAIDALLANKPVETSSTTPYGCSVKYANSK